MRRPLDILFVIADLRTGGTERQVALLAGALAKSGTSVAVYSLRDGEVRARLAQSGIAVTVAPVAALVGLPVAAVHLLWVMLTRRPRVAHFFLPAAYLVGAPLAALARVPMRVMSRRSLNTYQRSGLIRFIERKLHRLMQAVLGNSRGVVAQLRAEGVPPDRLGLIYNGVDAGAAAVTRDEARALLKLPATAMVLSIVANLIAYKGHRDLIAALGIAAPHLPPDWRLLVTGRDDGIGAALQEQAKRLCLQDHIAFLGPRADVATILAASDVGILCSHEEGFSNAILESMAAGLPMVVTDVGGNAEAVIDNETGLVVPARDTARLAAAIVRLANDPALRTRFGAAARQRAVDQFSVERFVQSHRRLYDALRAGRPVSDVPDVRVS
jgi:glycosyltransferase involved in cell wall biosynthesis